MNIMARGGTHQTAMQIDDDDMRVGVRIEELFAQPFAGAARSVRERIAIERPDAELLVVGGAVRDVVAGRKPKDLDLMVRGIPEDELIDLLERLAGDERLAMYQAQSEGSRQGVLDALNKSIRAGHSGDQTAASEMNLAQFDAHVASVPAEERVAWLPRMRGRLGREGDHFTVTRYHAPDRSEVEVVLPRADESTGDGHRDVKAHPNHLMSAEQDMARRDFTVNAMAFNLNTGELVDPFGGRDDLRERRLRTVSDQSFHDDHLRMLRGLVLAGRYGLDPDEVCDAQYRAEACNLVHVSNQRIVEELLDDNKILDSPSSAFAARVGERYGLMSLALDGLSIDLDAMERATRVSDDRVLRLAALVHATDPELAHARLHELEHEADVFNRVSRLLGASAAPRSDAGDEMAAWASTLGSRATALDALRLQAIVADLDMEEDVWVAALDRPIYRDEIRLTGRDLIAAGVKPGKHMGEILAQAQQLVWTDPAINDRDQLIARVDLHT